MSDTNIIVSNSYVEDENLYANSSHVEGENLILDESKSQYVKRFSPKNMNDNDTMNSLYDVQKIEIENFNVSIRKIINNAFIQSLDLNGVQKWEEFLKLTGNSKLSIDVRRRLILLKLLFKPPFTRLNFQEILESVWGEGNFIFTIYPDEFTVVIDIDTNDPKSYLQFQGYVRSVIPANMSLVLRVQYTYMYLKNKFTYAQLSAYDYAELSKYSE